jgi:ribosomal protein L7Ae-like RNA K-turn-binding protein
MQDKLSGLLGLARRAGRVTFGSDAVLKGIADGKAALVIIAADTAARTLKNIEEACGRTGTGIAMVPLDKSALGHAIGRGETAVAAVTDKAFSAGILELCRNNTGGIY